MIVAPTRRRDLVARDPVIRRDERPCELAAGQDEPALLARGSPPFARPGRGEAADQQQEAEQAGEHRQHADAVTSPNAPICLRAKSPGRKAKGNSAHDCQEIETSRFR